MNHKIARFTISTKKGETQPLAFLVRQSIPYPDTEGNSGSIRWRNTGGLFGSYYIPPEDIPEEFRCFLLSSQDAEVPEDWTRKHLAGYEGNPSPLSYRGQSLGEVTIELNRWDKIQVRGYGNSPTPGEAEMIREKIIPELRKFVAEHKAELRADALAKLQVQFDDQVARIRASADELENQAQACMARLLAS